MKGLTMRPTLNREEPQKLQTEAFESMRMKGLTMRPTLNREEPKEKTRCRIP
jgi:hypothetical protein